MASQEDHDGPRRKRSRTSKSEDSDDNKKRGRPRVEKQDQSAADVSNHPNVSCKRHLSNSSTAAGSRDNIHVS